MKIGILGEGASRTREKIGILGGNEKGLRGKMWFDTIIFSLLSIGLGIIAGKMALSPIAKMGVSCRENFQFYLSDLLALVIQFGALLLVLTTGTPPIQLSVAIPSVLMFIWCWGVGIHMLSRRGIKGASYRMALLCLAFPLTYGCGFLSYGLLIYWRIYCVIRGIRIDNFHHTENELVLFAAIPPAPSIFISHFIAKYVAERTNVKNVSLYEAYRNCPRSNSDRIDSS